MRNCGLRKILPQQFEINNAVDDGPVFVTPWIVDASVAIH